jgi:predicted CXXCH cytochrome family protein
VVSGNTAPDICGDNAAYGFYLGAHGNGTYGVDHNSRSYNMGECVNCHAANNISGTSSHGGQLFEANNEDFCFKCHTDTSSYQTGGLVNRSYSYRAGGYADTLNDIQEAFSFTAPATSHNLSDIGTFITGKWGYTSDSNPCVACHNLHIALGDPANAPNSRKTSGTRGYSPVSRPSLHSKDTGVWGLWGDVAAERTNTYASSLAGIYQAPNAASGYEPDGSSTQDGSNLTDFNTLCTDCHDDTNDITSTPLGGTLVKFDWSIDKHGGGSATDDSFGIDVKAPYQEAQLGTYVLACTDCHEPHGSPNNYLVRKQVNNGAVTVTQYGDNDEWRTLCERCHDNISSDGIHIHPVDVVPPVGADCMTCHDPHGGSGMFRNCMDCHFHGNRTIDGFDYGEQLF